MVILSGVTLSGVILSGVTLSGVILSGVTLSGVILSGGHCVTCMTVVATHVPHQPPLDEMFCGKLYSETVRRPFIEEVHGQYLLLEGVGQLQLEHKARQNTSNCFIVTEYKHLF